MPLCEIISWIKCSHTYVGVKAAVARASQPISASVVIWVIGGGVSGVVRHIDTYGV